MTPDEFAYSGNILYNDTFESMNSRLRSPEEFLHEFFIVEHLMFNLHALYVNFREVKMILVDNIFEEK